MLTQLSYDHPGLLVLFPHYCKLLTDEWENFSCQFALTYERYKRRLTWDSLLLLTHDIKLLEQGHSSMPQWAIICLSGMKELSGLLQPPFSMWSIITNHEPWSIFYCGKTCKAFTNKVPTLSDIFCFWHIVYMFSKVFSSLYRVFLVFFESFQVHNCLERFWRDTWRKKMQIGVFLRSN